MLAAPAVHSEHFVPAPAATANKERTYWPLRSFQQVTFATPFCQSRISIAMLWTTLEQREFLNVHYPEYQSIYSSSNPKYDVFWAQLREAWFKAYPEIHVAFPSVESEADLTSDQRATLSLAIQKRFKQVQAWYQWKATSSNHIGGRRGRKNVANKSEVDGANSRSLKPVEMYSQLYYKEKIQPRAKELIAELIAQNGRKLPPGGNLQCVKRATSEAYEAESPSIKAEVLEKIGEQIRIKEELQSMDASTARTPEQYLSAIDKLPQILNNQLHTLAEHTGWSFLVLMGGPHPNANGDVLVASFHVGTTPLGSTFGMFPKFTEIYMKPYTSFLEDVYPMSIRQLRKLRTPEDDTTLDAIEHQHDPYATDAASPFPESVTRAENPAGGPGTNDLSAMLTTPGSHHSVTALFVAPPSLSINAAPDSTIGGGSQLPRTILSPGQNGSDIHNRFERANPLNADHVPFSADTEVTTSGSITNALPFGLPLGSFHSGHTTQFETAPTNQPAFGAQVTGGYVPYKPLYNFGMNLDLPAVDDAWNVSDGNNPLYDPDYAANTTNYGDDMSVFDTTSRWEDSSGLDTAGQQVTSIQAPYDRFDHFFNTHPGPSFSTPPHPQPPIPSHSSDAPMGNTSLPRLPPFEPNADFGVRPIQTDSYTPSTPNPSFGFGTAPTNDVAALPSNEGTPAHELAPLPLLPPSAPRPASSTLTPALTPALPPPPVPKAAHSPTSSLLPLTDVTTNVGSNTTDARRSGRQVIPLKHSELLNKIGENAQAQVTTAAYVGKENIPPTGPPTWISLAKGHLLSRDLGEDWHVCVDVWFALEEKLGFGNTPGTKTALPGISVRPDEWSKWVSKSRNGARRYDDIPFIADSAELGIAVSKWWLEMQPAFRKGVGNVPAAVYNTDDGSVWDPLRKSGPNGLVSVMTLLVWWGQALADRTQYQTDSTAEWKQIIVDVKQCMTAIAATTTVGKKRRAAEKKENVAKRARA